MKYLDGYPELDLLSRALSFTSASVRVSTRIEAYSCKTINREKRLFKTLEQDIKSDLELSTSISPPDQHSANLQSAFGPLNQSASRKTMWLLIATLNLAFPDHDFSRVSPEEFIKEDSARSVLNSITGALSNLRASNSSAGIVNGQLGGADAAFRASLFASYPPPIASLPGYNPLVPSGAGGTRGRRSKLAATERYGSSAPASASSSSRRSTKESKQTGKQIFAANSSPPKRGKAGSAAYISKLKNDLDRTSDIPTHPFLRQVLEPIIELGECEVYSYTPDLESDPHAYNSEDEDDDFGSDDEKLAGDGDGMGSYEESEMMDMDGADDIGWEMDGVDSSYSNTPIGSIPPTPSGRPRVSRRNHLQGRYTTSGSTTFPSNMALWDEDGVRAAFDQAGNVVDDDDAGGLLWSSNYFLYNKKMRRILFISCWGRKIGSSPVPMTMPLPPVQHVLPPPSCSSVQKPNSSSSTGRSTKLQSQKLPSDSPAPVAEVPAREGRAPSILGTFQPSRETASLVFGGPAGGNGDLPPMVRESSPAIKGTVVNAATTASASVSLSSSSRKRSKDTTDLNNDTSHSARSGKAAARSALLPKRDTVKKREDRKVRSGSSSRLR